MVSINQAILAWITPREMAWLAYSLYTKLQSDNKQKSSGQQHLDPDTRPIEQYLYFVLFLDWRLDIYNIVSQATTLRPLCT